MLSTRHLTHATSDRGALAKSIDSAACREIIMRLYIFIYMYSYIYVHTYIHTYIYIFAYFFVFVRENCSQSMPFPYSVNTQACSLVSPVSTCSYTCLLHHSMVNTITSGQLCICTTCSWSAPENCAQSTPFPFPNLMWLDELVYTWICRLGGSRPDLKPFSQGVQKQLGWAQLLGEESLDRSGPNGG